MAKNKWMSQLTKGVAQAAADLPKPSDHVVKLPSPSLNWVVGNGGLTLGKAVCFYGPESGGKSFLAQLLMIQLQKDFPEGICIWFDAEFSFNPEWFAKLGGDLDRMIVKQTNDPLEIFDYIEKDLQVLLEDGCPVVGMAIDSVKSIRYPKDIKEKSTKLTMGGGGASYLGSALKGVLPVIRKYSITTALVQQVYEEMDEYKKKNNPYLVPDGRALKHFCDYMLEVVRIDTKDGRVEKGMNIYGGAAQVGHKVRVRGKKNRVGAPFRASEFTLTYTSGITNIGEEVYDLAKSLKVIKHPINPDTGRESPMLWQLGDDGRTTTKGEPAFQAMFISRPDLWDTAMALCSKIEDSDDVILERNNGLGYIDAEIGVPELD